MSPLRPRTRLLAPEHRALALALLALVGAWAFAALAWTALSGDSRALDEAVLRALREPGAPEHLRGPDWLLPAVRDLTSLGSHAVATLVVAAAAGFMLLLRKPAMAAAVTAAGAGGMLLNGALKDLFARTRPTIVPRLVEVGSPSFPSGHALVSAAVYLSIAIVAARAIATRRVRVYVVVAAAAIVVIVGLTRVLLGVHYPTDVVAGWVIGGLWALLCGLAARVLQRRGAVEAAGVEPAVEAPLEVSAPASEPPAAAAPRR